MDRAKLEVSPDFQVVVEPPKIDDLSLVGSYDSKCDCYPVGVAQDGDGIEPYADEEDGGPGTFKFTSVPAVVREMNHEHAKNLDDGFAYDQEMKNVTVSGDISDREKSVYRYFRKKQIMEFFQFLLGHLLANEPDDPISFLQEILDQCLLFRSGLVQQPPVLYEDKHLESLFNSFDPCLTGVISSEQYNTALKTLMIPQPEKSNSFGGRNVTKDEFISSLRMTLVDTLLSLILPKTEDSPKRPKFVGYDTTPARTPDKLTEKEKARSYLKKIIKEREAEKKALYDSSSANLQNDDAQIKVKPFVENAVERFGDYAQPPLTRLQDAFKPNSE